MSPDGQPAETTADRLLPSSVYRPTAAGLLLLGLLAGGLAVSDTLVDFRGLFLTFAGIGLFGSLLLWFLRPSATTETDPVEHVYTAFEANATALARDADLSDRHIYAPTTYEEPGFTPVSLTVPARAQGRVAIDRNRRPVFDSAPERVGSDPVTLYPTGAALFAAFEEMVVSDLSTDPVELADQLEEGLVLGVELVESVDVGVDADAGTATVTVESPRFGSLERFDHPVASFLSVGFAVSLDVPVVLERETDTRVTCQWAPDQVGDEADAD